MRLRDFFFGSSVHICAWCNKMIFDDKAKFCEKCSELLESD